ncbi:MAG: hypothetical protein NWE79_00705, partial [Candidatus Bathyarchaeota archaeon]|nr:hypothetical protein [Candidatus Bathyarchaeota archaeon]
MVSEEQAIPAEEDEHVIDLSGIATDLAPLDRGYYHFMVEEPPKKRFTDDDPDRPYYAWVLTITEPEELAGRKLFTNTTLQEHALFGFKRMLLGLGWTPES